jgi:hypothetical protein
MISLKIGDLLMTSDGDWLSYIVAISDIDASMIYLCSYKYKDMILLDERVLTYPIDYVLMMRTHYEAFRKTL